MARLRYFFIPALILWVLITLLQALGVVAFGPSLLSLSWWGYSSLLVVSAIVIDYLLKFRSPVMLMVYFIMLPYSIFFQLANIYNFYSLGEIVNRIEHIGGSILLTLIIWAIIEERRVARELNTRMRILLLGSLSITASVGNEIVELLLDLVFHTGSVGPSVLDTNWDLLMNVIGTGIVLAFIGWRARK